MAPWIITIVVEVLLLIGLAVSLQKLRGLPQRFKTLGIQQLDAISESGKTGKQVLDLNQALEGVENNLKNRLPWAQWVLNTSLMWTPFSQSTQKRVKTATKAVKWLMPKLMKRSA